MGFDVDVCVWATYGVMGIPERMREPNAPAEGVAPGGGGAAGDAAVPSLEELDALNTSFLNCSLFISISVLGSGGGVRG